MGQILRGTELGDFIYNLVNRKDVFNIVESGSWDGLGTTRCVLDGLRKDQKFISVELYRDMYELTIKNNFSYLQNQNIQFIHGSIIDYEDIFWFDHTTIDKNKDLHAKLWFQSDIDNLKISKNVLNLLPVTIDLLILDGGEYSTYPEWKKLSERTRIVVLDDSSIFKCSKIRKELLDNPEYSCLIDRPDSRNGFCAFERYCK